MKSTNNLDKFSLLMTVYEGDNDGFFDRALSSVCFEQTRKPDQVVLVADGPIGFVKKEIISKYQNILKNSFDFIQLRENVGQGAALNAGLNECVYELVARMDADDIARADRFEKQMEFMSKNPKVDLSSSYISEFDSSNRARIRKVPQKHDEIIILSKTRSPINHGACIYKKSKVLEAGGYNNTTQVQDYQLFVSMILNGCYTSNLNDVLLDVRISDDYARKRGLKYFKEEVNLACQFYTAKHIRKTGFLKHMVLRAFPRLLPARLISFLYRNILR